MTLVLAHIHPRPGARLPFEEEVTHYLKLASRWLPAQSRGFATEPAFQAYLEGMRRYPVVALCEQRGKMLTSEELAAWIGRHRDAGAGSMILAIGPADGWSATAIKSADLTLAFGSMTLPHALARLVLAEQVYRAASILGGHPYHLGH